VPTRNRRCSPCPGGTRDPIEAPGDPSLTEVVWQAVSPLLKTLAAFEAVQRYLHPGSISKLVELVSPLRPELQAGRQALESADWPVELAFVRDGLAAACRYAGEALDGFLDASREPTSVVPFYQAVRHSTRALEAVYPLFPVLRPVNSFFLEEPLRASQVILNRLIGASGHEVGVIASASDRKQRGGYSLYVPEYYDGSETWPVVVALHGGHGHGAEFLWSWVREARSRGFLLLAPTSRGTTWSLMGEDVDGDPVRSAVERTRRAYNVDPNRILLTGISDGGTYAFRCGLREKTPFTHLAPISCVLNPLILEDGEMSQAAGKRIYLVHGALDWMFPVDLARMARYELSAAGAELTYREIPDLSHTYPRDENARILDWFGAPLPGT
jgi:phospholipase/carboxylesterase